MTRVIFVYLQAVIINVNFLVFEERVFVFGLKPSMGTVYDLLKVKVIGKPNKALGERLPDSPSDCPAPDRAYCCLKGSK